MLGIQLGLGSGSWLGYIIFIPSRVLSQNSDGAELFSQLFFFFIFNNHVNSLTGSGQVLFI